MESIPLKRTEEFAIASLILSIFGIFSLMLYMVGLPSYILGIVLELSIAFGVIALLKIKRNPELEGKKMCTIVIIFSGIILVLLLIATLSGPAEDTHYKSWESCLTKYQGLCELPTNCSNPHVDTADCQKDGKICCKILG